MPRISRETIARARKAAEHLAQHNQPEHAAAVVALADAAEQTSAGRPSGWQELQELPIVVMWLPETVQRALKPAMDAKRGAMADELRTGYEAYLSGRWKPAKPARYPRGQAPVKKSMSTRISQDLIDRVNAYSAAHAGELADIGWTKGGEPEPPTHPQVAAAWLIERYAPKPQDTTAE